MFHDPALALALPAHIQLFQTADGGAYVRTTHTLMIRVSGRRRRPVTSATARAFPSLAEAAAYLRGEVL